MLSDLTFAPSGLFASLTQGTGVASVSCVPTAKPFFLHAAVIATTDAFDHATDYRLTIVMTNLTNGIVFAKHSFSGTLGDATWPQPVSHIEVEVTAGTVGDFYSHNAILYSNRPSSQINHAFGQTVVAVVP